MPADSPMPEERRSAVWRRRVGLTISLILLAGAVYFVVGHRDEFSRALTALRTPSPGDLALLAAAVLCNIALTGVLFHLLMSRFGRVGRLEMQGLIASATLLNYLPLRPGMFGRIAYHRKFNDIAVAHSARVVVEAVGLGVIVATWLVIAITISRAAHWPVWTSVLVPIPLLLAAAVRKTWRLWALAWLVRFLDVTVWAVRYLLVFRLIGSAIEFDTALLLACVSMLATLVPFLSNGLGLREWAVGFVTPLLESTLVMGMAVTADLVNRVVELIVVAVAGAIGLGLLARTHRSESNS